MLPWSIFTLLSPLPVVLSVVSLFQDMDSALGLIIPRYLKINVGHG